MVTGTEPYAEDTWKRIRIGEIEFDIVAPCVRCVVTTIEQETGNVLFGQYAVHKATGTLTVGDTVEILA